MCEPPWQKIADERARRLERGPDPEDSGNDHQIQSGMIKPRRRFAALGMDASTVKRSGNQPRRVDPQLRPRPDGVAGIDINGRPGIDDAVRNETCTSRSRTRPQGRTAAQRGHALSGKCRGPIASIDRFVRRRGIRKWRFYHVRDAESDDAERTPELFHFAPRSKTIKS